MSLAICKIKKQLSMISFTTAHAHIAKSKILRNLTEYEQSLDGQSELNLDSLFTAYLTLCWLLEHITCIDDKQVLPSERLFLSQTLTELINEYDEKRGV